MNDPMTAGPTPHLMARVAYALLCAPDGLGVGALSRMLGEPRAAVTEALSGLRAAGLAETAAHNWSGTWYASTPVPRGYVRLPVYKVMKREHGGVGR